MNNAKNKQQKSEATKEVLENLIAIEPLRKKIPWLPLPAHSLALSASSRIFHCRSLGSTNTAMRRCVEVGELFQSGDILLADTQTSGRGRATKTWHSFKAKNKSLTFSMLLSLSRKADTPALQLNESIVQSQTTALAICWLAADYGLPCMLKWPNDVHVLRSQSTKNLALTNFLQQLTSASEFPASASTPTSTQGQEIPSPVAVASRKSGSCSPHKNFFSTFCLNKDIQSMKLAGLLSEIVSEVAGHVNEVAGHAKKKFIIIGLGLNVNLNSADMKWLNKQTNKGHAAALFLETKQKSSQATTWLGLGPAQQPLPSTFSVLWQILQRLALLQKHIDTQGFSFFAKLWKKRSMLMGKTLDLQKSGQKGEQGVKNTASAWQICDLDENLFLHLRPIERSSSRFMQGSGKQEFPQRPLQMKKLYLPELPFQLDFL